MLLPPTRLTHLTTCLLTHSALQDYYSPDNSCINKVLETRKGIPITLGLLYMQVGMGAERGPASVQGNRVVVSGIGRVAVGRVWWVLGTAFVRWARGARAGLYVAHCMAMREPALPIPASCPALRCAALPSTQPPAAASLLYATVPGASAPLFCTSTLPGTTSLTQPALPWPTRLCRLLSGWGWR